MRIKKYYNVYGYVAPLARWHGNGFTIAANVRGQWTVKFTTACTTFASKILKKRNRNLQFVAGLLFKLVVCAPITFLQELSLYS